MRKVTYLLIYLASFHFSCKGQEKQEENHASIDFLEYIKGEYIDLLSAKVKNDTGEYKITLPYYEFSVSEIEVGEASLFAMSKDLSERWVEEAVNKPKAKCDKEGDYYPSFYIRCEAERLFTEDTTTLKANFDLYAFLIKKEDLNGPFMESAESGDAEYYEPKDNSTMIIYKYTMDKWEEVDQGKSNDIPRIFGDNYMEKLAVQRIRENQK